MFRNTDKLSSHIPLPDRQKDRCTERHVNQVLLIWEWDIEKINIVPTFVSARHMIMIPRMGWDFSKLLPTI